MTEGNRIKETQQKNDDNNDDDEQRDIAMAREARKAKEAVEMKER